MDYSKYNVLYINSEIIKRNDIIWGLLGLGMNVERAKCTVKLDECDEEEIENIKKEVASYDFAVTQNFSAPVAVACHECGKPYISWIYDSPQMALYLKEANYDTNYIFAFDKMQVERIKNTGCNRIFYQPLAANLAATSAINITDEDVLRYGSDISFVGGIYNQSKYFELLNKAPEIVKNNISDMYKNVVGNWGDGISPFNYLSDETIDYFYKYVSKAYIPNYRIDGRFLTEILYIIPTIAGFERREMLNRAGRHGLTKLFTSKKPEELTDIVNVDINPKVNADDEVYKVYYSSKINLNITLRSIETGIPQRVFDAMSVGGTVLSNYQEEMEELFVPEKDIITYKSFDEMEDKLDYYLRHENERVRIGINGYYRVRDEYNYTQSLQKMFDIVEKP